MLKNKKILIGITGSIAAYKTILLIRLLVQQQAIVKVVITPSAKNFVTPLVLATLSKNKVYEHLFNEDEWSNHVALGRWADVFVIAPLSCNTLGKMANGLCDNMLLATYLSATCPVVVCPAMDEDMWHHEAIQQNLKKLESFGNYIIPATEGELASGLFGIGRMAEPEIILQYIVEVFCRNNALLGKRVIVTAGPTYEAIDPVRFIGNHSSGKMGFAIAQAAYLQGASVTLITGPTLEQVAFNGIEVIKVKTAAEMFKAAIENFETAHIAIMSAAVADYTIANSAPQKIKKSSETLILELTKTKDILKYIGSIKKPNQYVMGFALETNNALENGMQKLTTKNADAIVVNSLENEGTGFGFNTNTITILSNNNPAIHFNLKSKQEVANDIISFIINNMHG
jgi:phosphopantothenoylcysteine decarboxylase / phosphopantothenate---cysteine ligase